MLNDINKHPAFQNSQIFTIRKQQLNNDLNSYIAQQKQENEKILSDHIPFLTEIYNLYNAEFQQFEKSFDSICYNLMLPILGHYGSLLFRYLQNKNSKIDIVSYQTNAANNLLDTLFNLSYKTLWTEFKEFVLLLPEDSEDMNENEVNRLFVSQFQADIFFSKYPILAKLLCDSAEAWLNKHRQIFNFLIQDFDFVFEYFGLQKTNNKHVEIQQITISGDQHDKDNFVAIIEFADNQKIVLKNRTAKPEMVLNKVIEFLSEKGIILKTPKLLEIDRNYWTEFITNKPCEKEAEFADFYFRIGNLLAVLYALNASDIHYENVIACGTFPVIVDAECLFSSYSEVGYSNNVLNISLLPSEHQIGKKEIWVGGTDNAGKQNALFSHWFIDEDYQTKEETGNFKNAQNMPFLQSGEIANVFEYQEHIKDGFCKVYDLILEHKTEFISIVTEYFPLKVRYLNRPTYSYNHLLRQSLFPRYLTDIFAYNWVFEWLWVNAEVNPKYNALVPCEQEMLRQHVIPFFYNFTNSTDLYSMNNNVAKKIFFEKTAEKLFLEKIQSLSIEDRNIQQKIIELQFVKLANRNLGKFTSKNFFKQVINKIEKSIFSLDNTVEVFDFIEGNVQKVEINLYDGYTGYLLFLIYYHKIHKDNSVNNLISIIYRKIIFEIDSNGENLGIGAFIGISGCLYVLTHLYILEQKEIYLEEIEKIEKMISSKINDKNLMLGNDILSGIAGCIVCLYGFYEVKLNKKTKSLIIRLSEILIENSEKINENKVGWVSKMGVPLVAYSHGNAGIGQALLIAYQLTENQKFIDIFQKSMNFENSYFDKNKRVWADTRKEIYEFENTSWCNGTAGIGLARMKYCQFLADNSIFQDVKIALETTLKFGVTDIDVLCHGNCGTIEFLLYYYQNIEKNEKILTYLEKIKTLLLDRIDNNKIKCNVRNELSSISLMTGITGIAYQLLRLENPEFIPSVLLLEIPKLCQ